MGLSVRKAVTHNCDKTPVELQLPTDGINISKTPGMPKGDLVPLGISDDAIRNIANNNVDKIVSGAEKIDMPDIAEVTDICMRAIPSHAKKCFLDSDFEFIFNGKIRELILDSEKVPHFLQELNGFLHERYKFKLVMTDEIKNFLKKMKPNLLSIRPEKSKENGRQTKGFYQKYGE